LLLGKSVLKTLILELHFRESPPHGRKWIPQGEGGGELYLQEFSKTLMHKYLELLFSRGVCFSTYIALLGKEHPPLSTIILEM